jgi:hypothetical protein
LRNLFVEKNFNKKEIIKSPFNLSENTKENKRLFLEKII